MIRKWFTGFLMALWLVTGNPINIQAQEIADKKEEEKDSPEKKALALLEQVVSDMASLKLPENRIQLQIIAADLLWTRNEARARSLFEAAVAEIYDLMKAPPPSRPDRRYGFEQSYVMALHLRQKLVSAAAQHNSILAYQLLQATKPPTDTPYKMNMDMNLEQTLLAQIARTDPLLAVKNAGEMLDKGQYPYALMQVIAELQTKDKEAAAKLTDKLLKQLQAEDLLSKPEAVGIAMNLLRAGPRLAENASADAKAPPNMVSQFLSETAFRNLLEQVIQAALKNTPAVNFQVYSSEQAYRGTPEAAQQAQMSRSLMMVLQTIMPQVEKYAPTRVAALRQKLAQTGMTNTQRPDYSELIQKGTSETMLTAAATAPDYLKRGLYEQAAMKAVTEGNLERAKQIVNDHPELPQLGSILKLIETQQVSGKMKEATIDSVRLALGRIPSEEERFRFLIELAEKSQKENPKLAVQILEEAQKSVGGQADSYEQLDNQLAVAEAFTELDAGRSFEILEPGISQLNELFPAAAVLSGFDVQIFRNGEMVLSENGGRLSIMVKQYGERLAELAQKDFDRAVKTADRLQLYEARLFVRLAIARQVLSAIADAADQ